LNEDFSLELAKVSYCLRKTAGKIAYLAAVSVAGVSALYLLRLSKCERRDSHYTGFLWLSSAYHTPLRRTP
jgi:hypothetical protein